MSIKTPKFWLKRNLYSYFLYPFSIIYNLVAKLHDFSRIGHKVNKKIICIGNVTVGGSGKTPVALMIGEILKKRNIDFAYLSAGYKGKKDLVEVMQNSNALDVGDEPLLLREVAPTFIAKKRFKGAQEIAKLPQFSTIITDDGLQNSSLKKDFSILVIDGKIKFGNNFIFPAGPLRESAKSGLKKSDLTIVIGEIDQDLQKILQNHDVVKAVVKAKNLEQFKSEKLIAFCGLAYPQKFFLYLENQGLNLLKKIEFADHFNYSDSDLEKLQKIAVQKNAKLVTTKKDWVKFSPKFKEQINYLDIALAAENEAEIAEKLLKIINN